MIFFHSLFIAVNFFLVNPNLEPDPQKLGHTSWSYSIKQNGCEAELMATATIDDGWYIYSQFQPNEDGPVPTSFKFKASADYELIGKVSEGKAKSKYMEGFDGNYNIFEHTVTFKQKIKIKGKKDFTVTGEMEFMQCDETMCLPPEYVDLNFKVKGCSTGTEIKETTEEEVVEEMTKEDTNSIVDSSAKVTPIAWTIYSKKYSDSEYEIVIEALIDSNWNLFVSNTEGKKLLMDFEFPKGIKVDGKTKWPSSKMVKLGNGNAFQGYKNKITISQKLIVETSDSTALASGKVYLNYLAISEDGLKASTSTPIILEIDLTKSEEVTTVVNETSYLGIFILAFLSGFIALLTPCVFPMIPMTVSFFLKSSKSRAKAISNAMIYGVSIIVIYVTIGLAITAIFDAGALNELATNVWFNLTFFLLLVVFAISFLGAFEITLPSSWVNAADKNSDRGGLIGIFFMAATLGLVSFSCTGPIIGTQLVIAAEQGGMGPFFAMLGFSSAIAIPFTLFAIFPGWLNSMPSSGGWLNTVKVSLGFLELALALKFLSKADLVTQSHLLEREMFIGIWVAIFLLWGLYLLGVFKTSHDSEAKHIGVGRIFIATLVISFTFYLIPGLWGAPLKLIAGIAPPMHYSESPFGVNGKAPDVKLPKHASFGPHGLITFHDYEHGLEYAKKNNKPVMIDFTGHGCENCRKMEDNVWSEEGIKSMLRDSVVIISLHVDEKIPLPEASNITNKNGKRLKYTGQVWAEMEQDKYGEISQPLYVLLDHNEEMLNIKASYESHGKISLFKPWLEEGIKKFEKRKGYKKVKPEMMISQSEVKKTNR
jgi:thiol:disulfide interchange protein